MEYENISRGRFLKRPNRFIAQVEIQEDGKIREETVHVKNTGRCRELLAEGAEVYLEKSSVKERKTAYDLIAVKKGDVIVNMDSNAPNKAVREWLESGEYFKDVKLVRPETTYGNSRFDFYVETGSEKIFIEVKGVTLEQQGMALFPDAPSVRAVKHVEELIEAQRAGYESYVLFVIQMKGINGFTPNRQAQPEFADALLRAQQAGVRILAYDCLVTLNSMKLADPVPVMLDQRQAALNCIASPLLAWYDGSRRKLPWREEPTPYRVWISEIMLQQTRVEAVKPYFQRFMERLPDVEALASVSEDALLKLWEGLGYYSRARNLQKAARQIMEEYNGQIPSDYDSLVKLQGIGSYTAGAIASIAFGQLVPAVDGNVLRVISRLLADDRDILNPAVKKKVEEELLPVMPKERPGDFNQALMELGAMVCLPNGAPKCTECPWESLCRANLTRTQTQYPKKSAKKPRKIEKRTILVIRDIHCVAIRKRPANGLLAGLYEFPSMEGHADREEVLAWLKEQGVHAVRIEKLPPSKHIFTHKEWHMTGFSVLVDELEPMKKDKRLLFVEPEETEEKYPIPSAFAVYTQYLNIRTGSEKIKNVDKNIG
ncbi:MAG: A/G-specific adenine glycosylase [Eubacteriales bacterium]|nr:A/G-specific adenine glycosylase [Eubacteriales bacterium]